jgi:hypothetical protein
MLRDRVDVNCESTGSRHQQKGGIMAEKDEYDWQLAIERPKQLGKWPTRKPREFIEIVTQELENENGSDWDSIRRTCPNCHGNDASPWDHYVYHRGRPNQAANKAGGEDTNK